MRVWSTSVAQRPQGGVCRGPHEKEPRCIEVLENDYEVKHNRTARSGGGEGDDTRIAHCQPRGLQESMKALHLSIDSLE